MTGLSDRKKGRMSRIILPNGQQIRQENEITFYKREIFKLKCMVKDQNDIYMAKLLSQQQNLEKLDKIMDSAFKRIDAYEEKLKELGVNPKDILDGERKSDSEA